MNAWDNLLQSSVPEDIALAVFLMDRAGELKDGIIPIPNNNSKFVIDTNKYSCWTIRAEAHEARTLLGVRGDHVYGHGGLLHFDFRTK